MQANLKRALALTALLGLIGSTGLLVNATPARAQVRASVPRLADLMNEAMQVHHTKLWFAGHAHNWALAGYELAKIKETIEQIKEAIVDIQTASAQWRRVPVGEMLISLDISLRDLDRAVAAKDPAKFDTAYGALTATCNACHTAAAQPQIKIIVPAPNGNGMFPDQDFTGGG